MQKYGFTIKDNPHSKISFEPYDLWDMSLVNQESKFKRKLFEKTGIADIQGLYHFYEKKFDANILACLRIAFLTSDMVDKFTFEHLWEKETFREPLSSTQEELVLNSIYNYLNNWYSKVKHKNYAELRDNIQFDSTESVNLYNIYNIQHEEERILRKNLIFIQRKLDKLHHQRLIDKREELLLK